MRACANEATKERRLSQPSRLNFDWLPKPSFLGTSRLIGLGKTLHNAAHEWKRAENRDLQAVRRSVRVDEENSVSAVRFEKMARNRFRCLACKPWCGWWRNRQLQLSGQPRRQGDSRNFNERSARFHSPVLITGICVLICVVLLLIVLFAWLRARGRFIFVDCVVRNRAAIVAPWKEFRAEGNSFFLFSLLVVLVSYRCDRDCGSCTHCAVYPAGDQVPTWCRISGLAFR